MATDQEEKAGKAKLKNRLLFLGALGLSLALGIIGAFVIANNSSNSKPSPAAADPNANFKSANLQLNTTAPRVGSCWDSKDWEATYSADYYIQGNSVDCSKSHDSITFQLGQLPNNAHFYFFDPMSLSSSDTGRALKEDAIQICRSAFESEFGTSQTRLGWAFFLPDPFAWAAGARWVRCDVWTIKWNSTVGKPIAAQVESDLEETRQHYANNDYQICLATDAGNPFDYDARYADCSGEWDFKLAAEQSLSGKYGEIYPGEFVVTQDATNFCSSYGEGLAVYHPTESGWSGGTRSVTCWESNY